MPPHSQTPHPPITGGGETCGAAAAGQVTVLTPGRHTPLASYPDAQALRYSGET